jgi:hypothetical protein
MAATRAANTLRDLGHRQVGVAQEAFRPFNAAVANVPLRRHADRLPEQVREVTFAHRQMSGDIRHAEVAMQVRFDERDGPS